MDLRELQLFKLNVLRDVAHFCDQNHIRYVLAWGTLLGAVRHGGFIPWDDDIDIAMPLEDYKKFIKIAKDNLSTQYFVQNYLSDPGFPMMYTQIRVNETTSMPKDLYKLNIHWGICIDVFPMVGVWKTCRGLSIQRKLLSLANSLLVSDYMNVMRIEPQGAQKIINLLPQSIRRIGVRILMGIVCMNADKQQDYFCLEDNNIQSQGKKCEWIESMKWRFEGEEFWIPKAYDVILTKAYGEYMILPPPEQRGGHELTLGEQIVDLHKSYTAYQQEMRSE